MATVVAPAFIIMLVFTSPKLDVRTISCANQECVETVVSHAHESPYLRRLAVFKGDEFARFPGGSTLWPGLLDVTFD